MSKAIVRAVFIAALLSFIYLGDGALAADPSFSVVASIPVGNGANGVAVNWATNRIYVTNRSDGTVSVLNGDTNLVVATIPVGDGPGGIGANPNTNKIYVIHGPEANLVSVIDGGTSAVTTTLPVANNARGVAVNPDTNRIYVTTGPGQFVGTVLEVIDGQSDVIITSVDNIPPAYAIGGAVSVDRAKNLVYFESANATVSVLDGSDNEIVDVIGDIGPGGRFGLDTYAELNRVYVIGAGAISVIDELTNSEIEELPIEPPNSLPQGLAANPTTGHLFISSYHGTVAILDTSTGEYIEIINPGGEVAGCGSQSIY